MVTKFSSWRKKSRGWILLDNFACPAYIRLTISSVKPSKPWAVATQGEPRITSFIALIAPASSWGSHWEGGGAGENIDIRAVAIRRNVRWCLVQLSSSFFQMDAFGCSSCYQWDDTGQNRLRPKSWNCLDRTDDEYLAQLNCWYSRKQTSLCIASGRECLCESDQKLLRYSESSRLPPWHLHGESEKYSLDFRPHCDNLVPGVHVTLIIPIFLVHRVERIIHKFNCVRELLSLYEWFERIGKDTQSNGDSKRRLGIISGSFSLWTVLLNSCISFCRLYIYGETPNAKL